jgi:hypothetical protein
VPSLSDGAFVHFGTCLWNITYRKWFLLGGAYPVAASWCYLGLFARHSKAVDDGMDSILECVVSDACVSLLLHPIVVVA